MNIPFFKRIYHAARRIPAFDRAAAAFELRREFPVEHRLMRGGDPSASERPSVLHFSVNKAATQYAKSVLFQFARANRMLPVALHDLAFRSNLPYMTGVRGEAAERYQRVFRQKGYVYSAFGGVVPWIRGLENYRIVIIVRDPRDILVSEYYSIGWSHSIPPRTSHRRAELKKKRVKARELSVDEYVLSRLAECRTSFEDITRFIDGFRKADGAGHLEVLRYEDMVESFESWLSTLVRACGFDPNPELESALLAERSQNMKVLESGEDKKRHLRKGAPGDHREKLMPESCITITSELESLLGYFGYPP